MPFLLFAEAASIFFFMFIQLLARNKQPLHYCMVIGSFALGSVILYSWAMEAGLIARVPGLAYGDIAATFLAAPAFYLSSLTILHDGRRPVCSYALYFVLPTAFAVCAAVVGALAASSHPYLPGSISRYSSPVSVVMRLSADLLVAAAFAGDLVMARRLHTADAVRDRSGFRHQVIFLFFYLGSSLALVSSALFRIDRLFVASVAAFGLVAMAYALSRSAVFYISRGRASGPAARPEWDRSAPELTARLERLMESSALYRDSALSLQRLAHALGVEPKRLSYHLHAVFSMTFRTYLNEWRLKAVCRDLCAASHRSILHTAFENGFNSKSSFNTLFYQKYGRTPRDFRRENLHSTERRTPRATAAARVSRAP